MARLSRKQVLAIRSCGNLGNRSGKSLNNINGRKAQSATWCIAGPTYECSPEKWHTWPGAQERKYQILRQRLGGQQQRGGKRR